MSPSSVKTAAALSSSPAAAGLLTPPDGRGARDAANHFTQPFRVAAVRYALSCGKTQRKAADDMNISVKSLNNWINDAQPSSNGDIDVERFDELATLRAKVREQDALIKRVCLERDFLKKASAYFATSNNPIGGSK